MSVVISQSCASHCPLSRRRFLSTVSAGALGTAFLPSLLSSVSLAEDLTDVIDIGSLRSRPPVKIKGVFIRFKPPYWLGWPGTSYDLEGYRKKYMEEFAAHARKLGVDLQQEESPLESEEALNTFVEQLKAEKPDAVLVSVQHMGVWGWADRIAQAGIPTLIFAPVGTCFTGHVLEISRRPHVHVISSLEVSAVAQAMRMIRAKKQFDATTLLVVAGDKRAESVMERLNVKVKTIPRRSLNEMFERMPETDEMKQLASVMRRHAKKVVEPSKQDLLNAARSYCTAKKLMKDEGANAITTDCLGMVTMKVVPTPPCMAVSMFQDAGVTYGCEADVNGALSLMLTSYLLDKPGFMNDPVPETVKNTLVVAHCVCGTKLNGFDQPSEPFILRSHSESALGVSVQVLWKIGQPATLVSFQGPHQLVVDTGTVVSNVDTPPAGGCRTSVELKMDRMEDARDVLGFHQVVFYGDHRRDIEAFCQMNEIKVINSPEKAPKRESA